jgi:ribonuclease HI
MHERKFSFDPINLDKNIISGGEHPLLNILGPDFFRPSCINSLKKHKILYLSQLTSCDGTLLLKWQDLNYKPQFNNLRRTPFWFNRLENIVLQSPSTSRRLSAAFCTLAQPIPPILLTSPEMSRRGKREWVAIWNNDINQAVIGRIIQKDPLNNAIVVQHWCHYIDNTDISPSKAAPIVYQCPGCEINVARYNQLRPYRKQTSRYTCTTKYYASGAVLFPRAIKQGNNFVLTVSLFELKQMAKERFLQHTRPPRPRYCPPHDDTVNDPIIRYVTNKLVRTKLIALKQKFKFAPTLTYYTDGSLKDPGTDTMKMGIGWVQTESFPCTSRGSFSAQVERFPSSTRAEIYAILSALVTAPRHCNIKLYLDNETAVKDFLSLLSGANKFNHNHQSSPNYILWLAIKFVIHSMDLKVSVHWVKAHSKNLHNDEADALAKSGRSDDTFDFSTSFLPDSFHILSWYKITVDLPTRDFVKTCNKAKTFNNVFNSQRLFKLKNLSHCNKVDWTLTQSILSSSFVDDGTSIKNTRLKAFQVKCFTQELPCLIILQTRRPDLYTPDWRCASCKREPEDFHHIWFCLSRRPKLMSCVNDTIDQLCASLSNLRNSSVSLTTRNLIANLPMWSLVEDSEQLTLIDTIKGAVPTALIELLLSLGFLSAQITSVVSSMYSFFNGLLRIHLWKPRCDDFVQAEHSKGITAKKKKSKFHRSPRAVVANPGVTIQHSSRTHDSNLTQWSIWTNYVCQYGGTYQGF